MLGSGIRRAALLLQVQPVEKRHDLVEHARDHREEQARQGQHAQPDRRARVARPVRHRLEQRSRTARKRRATASRRASRLNVTSVWRRRRRACSQSVTTAYDPASSTPAMRHARLPCLRHAEAGSELQRPQAEHHEQSGGQETREPHRIAGRQLEHRHDQVGHADHQHQGPAAQPPGDVDVDQRRQRPARRQVLPPGPASPPASPPSTTVTSSPSTARRST